MRTTGFVLAVLGCYLVGLSVFMLIVPGTFVEGVGPFGPRNDHYVRDAATFQLALGVLSLVAVARREVRLVTVVVIGTQFLLHTINHLVDIDEADPSWLGPADFASLLGATTVLAWLFLRVRREGR